MLTTNAKNATELSVKNDFEPVQPTHTLYQYSYRPETELSGRMLRMYKQFDVQITWLLY